MLAALGLALDHDAGGQVCKPHGRLDLVDVLSAMASRPKRVNFEIFGPNVDFDAVVNLRNHEDGCERGVAAGCLVEWRNADEPMHACFGGEQAIGIFALHADGYGLEPRAFARLRIDHRSAKVLALTPAQVHA